MKKNILKLVLFSALFTFFAVSFNSNSEAIGGNSSSAANNWDCKGSDGHCMEYKNTTYYGKLIISDSQTIDGNNN